MADGNITVDVTMKNINNRNIISVIDDIENVSRVENGFFNAILPEFYKAGSLSKSMNSIVLFSREFMILFTRDTR